MEKLIDLKDLLKHEILDLYSAEQQIIEALPLMINKAGNSELKNTLQEHLDITEKQKTRLEELQQMLAEIEPAEKNEAAEDGQAEERKPGFFSRLFGGGEQKCRGMEGLISEGKKMMEEDMSPEAADAAIIAGAQKIEHYEICGYGTARAYARELNLAEVADKLELTLNEEYEADDRLTKLAVGKLNVEAEFAGEQNQGSKSESKENMAGSASNNNGSSAKSNTVRTSPSSQARSGARKGPASATKSATKSSAKSSPAKSSAKLSPAKKSSPSKSSPSKSSASKSSIPKSRAKSSPAKSPAKSSPAKSTAKKGNVPLKKTGSSARPAATKSSSNGRGTSKKGPAKSSSNNRSKPSAAKTRSSR